MRCGAGTPSVPSSAGTHSKARSPFCVATPTRTLTLLIRTRTLTYSEGEAPRPVAKDEFKERQIAKLLKCFWAAQPSAWLRYGRTLLLPSGMPQGPCMVGHRP